MGFHDHQGTGIGINWVSEVYNFSIKLDSLWPVCLPDLWLDGVNANMIVELGYKEVCVCVCVFWDMHSCVISDGQSAET